MEKPELIRRVTKYVEDNIGSFHQSRIDKVKGMTLNDIISSKNPYLFKAKNMLTAQGIIDSILSATISSSEETMFGNWLEGLAIFINGEIYNGQKSAAPGIDIEFIKAGVRYIVVIKSGPSWGNANAVEKMNNQFQEARRRLSTSGHKEVSVCVNGCCYGKDGNPHKFPSKGTDYFKYCGQEFWSFISGDDDLYTEIIEPLGHKVKEKNDLFNEEYSALSNRLTAEFLRDFCVDGVIQWVKLVRANSERPAAKVKKEGKPKKSTPVKVGKLEKIKQIEAAKKKVK